MDFDDVTVTRIGWPLPEVEVSTSCGTASLHVRGRSLCRLRSEREHNRDDVHDTEVLVVCCELEVNEAPIESFASGSFRGQKLAST